MPVLQQQQKKVVAPSSRWAAAESSSSDDEGRVVKSLKDRRWGAMREVIRQMENHMKILDFAELGKGKSVPVIAFNLLFGLRSGFGKSVITRFAPYRSGTVGIWSEVTMRACVPV